MASVPASSQDLSDSENALEKLESEAVKTKEKAHAFFEYEVFRNIDVSHNKNTLYFSITVEVACFWLILFLMWLVVRSLLKHRTVT